MRNQGVLLCVVLAVVTPAISQTDLTVGGNLIVKKDAVVDRDFQVSGKLGVGVANPVANLQVDQNGIGVGIYLGNRTPSGQALFETDLTVPATHAWFAENGNRVFSVTAGGTGFFKGRLGISVADPVASLQINQSGTGVGVYLGNRTPFGQALFETDLTVPATHAWFAENGNRVFSVTAGGDGVFGGRLDVGHDTRVEGRLDIGHDAQIEGRLDVGHDTQIAGSAFVLGDIHVGNIATVDRDFFVGNLIVGSVGQVQVFGERIFPAFAPTRFIILPNGNIGVGTDRPQDKLHVIGNITVTGNESVKGRVVTQVLQITGGSDVAEQFQMSDENIPDGAVVIIDERLAGHLKLSDHSYDKRVAGVISGANGIVPGISLGTKQIVPNGRNVALSGRVYVLADASNGLIRPGDLLTTSNVPGHAMRVTNYAKARGAVIGKAMSPMKEGTVLVLIALQ